MRALILYNPTSGKGRFKKNIGIIKDALIKKGYNNLTIYESLFPKDLTKYINEHLNIVHYDLLVVSGGDGTFNEVINGIMNINVIPNIFYIPSGTANDVGHILRLNKNIKKSINIFNQDNIKKIDICKMNDYYFLYAMACGKFSDVSYNVNYKRKKMFGYLHYLKNGILQLNKKYSLDTYINQTFYNLYLFIGIKGSRVAAFKIKRKKNSKLNSGEIDLVLFKNNSYFSFLNMIFYFLTMGLYKHNVISLSNNKFEILTQDDYTYNIDGEKACTTNKVTIEVLKETIPIYVPTNINNLFD